MRHFLGAQIDFVEKKLATLLVLLVATAIINFGEHALVVGTNQSRQANKAVRPAWFVLCPLLELTLPSGFLSTHIPCAIYFS